MLKFTNLELITTTCSVIRISVFQLKHSGFLIKVSQHISLKHEKKYFINVLTEEEGWLMLVKYFFMDVHIKKITVYFPNCLFILEQNLNPFQKYPAGLFSNGVYFCLQNL